MKIMHSTLQNSMYSLGVITSGIVFAFLAVSSSEARAPIFTGGTCYDCESFESEREIDPLAGEVVALLKTLSIQILLQIFLLKFLLKEKILIGMIIKRYMQQAILWEMLLW